MKWTHMILAAVLSLAGTLSSSAEENGTGVPVPATPKFTTGDPAAYGRELAFYMDRYDQGWVDEVAQGSMTLFDADGDSVRRSFLRMIHERAAQPLQSNASMLRRWDPGSNTVFIFIGTRLALS